MINVGDGEFVDPEQLWLNLYIFSTYKPDTQCLYSLVAFARWSNRVHGWLWVGHRLGCTHRGHRPDWFRRTNLSFDPVYFSDKSHHACMHVCKPTAITEVRTATAGSSSISVSLSEPSVSSLDSSDMLGVVPKLHRQHRDPVAPSS